MNLSEFAFHRSLRLLLPLWLLAAGGCRPMDSKIDGLVNLRLDVFSSQSEQDLAKKLIAGFEKTHPKIKIAIEAVPQGNYGSKLGMQSAADTLPDVVCLVDALVPTLVRYHVVQNLWPYIRKDRWFNVKDIYPAMLENGLDDSGNLFMLPRELGVVVMLYNRTLFRRVGLPDPSPDWTWAQFVDCARKLTLRESSGRVVQYGFNGSFSWPGLYAPAIVGNGGSLLSPDGRHSTLSSPASVRGLRELVELVTREHVAIPPGQSAGSGFDPFAQGQAAMEAGVFPLVANLRVVMKQFDWDAQVMPGWSVRRVSMTGAAGYGMSASTRHPKEAWEFLSFIAGPDGQRILGRSGSGIPALKSLQDDPSWRNRSLPPRNLDAFLDSAKFGMTWRGILLFAHPEVDDVVRSAFDRALAGQETVEDAFARADRQIDEIIVKDAEDQ